MKITMDLTMSEVKEMINNGSETVPVDQEAVDINTKLAFEIEELEAEITKLRSIIEGLESVTPKVEVYRPQTYGDPIGVIDGLPAYERNGRYMYWYGPDYDDKYAAEDMKLLATLVKEIKR